MTLPFTPLTHTELYTLLGALKSPRSAAELAIMLDTPYERIRAVLEYWNEIGKVHHAQLNGCTAHWLYTL